MNDKSMTPSVATQRDMGVDGLRECPFCGKSSAYSWTRNGDDCTAGIRCNGCGATTADFKSDPATFSGEPAAIAAWNRRAMDDAKVQAPAGYLAEAKTRMRESIFGPGRTITMTKADAIEIYNALAALSAPVAASPPALEGMVLVPRQYVEKVTAATRATHPIAVATLLEEATAALNPPAASNAAEQEVGS